MTAPPPWLSLLVRLTETCPGWAVWKNVDAALGGDGDIDSTAPRPQWPSIESAFEAWARENGFGPVAICRHIPGGLNLIALLPSGDAFVELGVKDRRVYRGATLFRPEQLVDMFVMDGRGFRKLRPGAEGFVKLLLNGLSLGGRINEAGLRRKNVVELMRGDLEGARAATALVGTARGAAEDAIDALLDGRWDRPRMLAIEARMVARALVEPHVLMPRLWFRAFSKRACPVVRAMLFGDRAVPGDTATWLRRVERRHRVVRTLA